jgi:FKBP-type peptidyl-prolyl cis-trans isomerase 2/SAM-dependent methyltransferase
MHTISNDNLATLQFELDWLSDVARHKDVVRAEPVNFWRDIFPEPLEKGLQGSAPGDRLHFSFPPGQITPAFDSKKQFQLKNQQFERREINSEKIEPRRGRFYPKGLLKGISGIHPENVTPFRCSKVTPTDLSVDFNHPLAEKAVELQVTVDDVRAKNGDRGGRLEDWMEVITNGPGMQGRYNGSATDFFSGNPFARADENEDALFYKEPRLVTHIDSQAQEMIKKLYGDILKPGMRVLDLMSSWRSHVPDSLELASLVGLGMNSEEMADNPQLTDFVVHDVNTDPKLPFDDQSFDAVICTVSVEYMTQPFEVFADVARVLKPTGTHIHTFSNRWFPPKAIQLWTELTEFERMGLVLEYFLQTGAYRNLQTYSARGWPRPETDRYYPEMLTADPVYAVWGQRAS